MNKTIPISIRIANEDLDFLKKIARKKSYEEDKDIRYPDLIRTAIKKVYLDKNKDAC